MTEAKEETPEWHDRLFSAGDLYNLFLGTAEGMEDTFSGAMEAGEGSTQTLKFSKMALFHTTTALRSMAETVKVSAEARTKEINESPQGYIKKSASVGSSRWLEEQGFKHVCGGGVIGCRCLENWYFSKGLDHTGHPLPPPNLDWLT